MNTARAYNSDRLNTSRSTNLLSIGTIMTHGMLRNRETGIEIPATLRGKDTYYFNINLDGDPRQRRFSIGIWKFIPDVPELPTTPGLYQIVVKGMSHKIEHAPTYRATGGGRWVNTLNNQPISESARRLLLNAHKDGRLIRLVLDPEHDNKGD